MTDRPKTDPVTHPTSEPRLDEALPCPFCGEVCVSACLASGFKWGAIICTKCCAAGPEVRTEYKAPKEWYADAVAEWNTRTALPVPPVARSGEGPSRDEVATALAEALNAMREPCTPTDRADARKSLARALALYRPAGERREVVDVDARADAIDGVVLAIANALSTEGGWHLDAKLDGSAAVILAKEIVGWFKEYGGTNYVEMKMLDPDTSEVYVVTVQRANGKTPHELRAEATAELNALRASLAASQQEVERLTRIIAQNDEVERGCYAEIDALRADVERIRAALQRHGAHDGNCARLFLLTSNPPLHQPCDCGLAAALASPPPETTQGETDG